MRMELSTASAPVMLVRSTRLLAAIGGLAMATTGECSPIVLAAFLAFFLIGMRVEAFPALHRLLSWAQPFFALLVFARFLVGREQAACWRLDEELPHPRLAIIALTEKCLPTSRMNSTAPSLVNQSALLTRRAGFVG